MVHLLESTGMHCRCPKAAVSRRNQGLPFLNQLERSRPSYLSCNLFHRRNRLLVLFHESSTCRQPIPTVNCRLISSSVELNSTHLVQQQVKSPTFVCSISNGTKAGMNFFRKKQSRKQSKSLQSILIRSALYFASKQNFLFDFLLNNWSEYNKIVLNADSDGGQGGGFTFIPGLGGGGEDNFPRKRRKAPKKWWWVLPVASILVLSVLSGIYYGKLKLPPNFFDGRRLERLVVQAGSFGLLALVLFVIVGAVALTGSILVRSLTFLMKKSKVTIFPPRTRSLSLPKSLTTVTLLSTMGLGMLYPKIPKALAEEVFWYVKQLKQTTDSQMRAAQKKVATMFNTATRGSKARNRRKGRPF